MNFQDAVVTCLKKFATFSGRATRREFWWFQLFLCVFLGSLSYAQLEPLSSIFDLAMLLPNLAVSCRRLHDTGRSGWWLLLLLVPVVGWIVLLIFFLQKTKGDGGLNEYPDNPAAGSDRRRAATSKSGERLIGNSDESR